MNRTSSITHVSSVNSFGSEGAGAVGSTEGGGRGVKRLSTVTVSMRM